MSQAAILPASANTLTMPLELLRDIRASIIPAACTDKLRPILATVHLAANDGRLVAEATNTYCAHHASIPYDGPPFDANIPAQWLAKINLPVVNKKRPTDVIISCADGRASVACNTDIWSTAAVDGDFPNVSALIEADPPPDEGGAALNSRYLAAALKAAHAWGGDDSPIHVISLNAMKPCRFEVLRNGAERLRMIVMPVRQR